MLLVESRERYNRNNSTNDFKKGRDHGKALLVNEVVSVPAITATNTVNEMENGENTDQEGTLLFKKGLLGKWIQVNCKLSKDTFCVCYCNDKNDGGNEGLLSFTPLDSWISSRWNEKTGLFVLNATGKSSCKLYLFETKSEDNLHQWLDGFIKAGWKQSNGQSESTNDEPTCTSAALSTTEEEDTTSNATDDHLLSINNLLDICTDVTDQQQQSHNDDVTEDVILSSDDDEDDMTEKENATAFARLSINSHHTIEPLRVDISHDHVESGYCSKESLSPDVEKGFFKADLPVQQRQDGGSLDADNNGLTTEDEEGDHRIKQIRSNQGHSVKRGEYDTRSLQLLSDDFDPDSSSQGNFSVDQTRSEKKATVGHLFSQLKYRFAPSKRVKARKGGRRGTFGGHLLCNQKGTWKTMWFYLQDNILYAFRDIGLKPALMKINLKDSKLFCFVGKEMRDLGIFKVLNADVDVTFAAWSQTDYKEWMIAFDSSFLSKECIDDITMRDTDVISPSLESEIDGDHDDDLFADSVIPYEQAEELEMETTNANATTSRTSSETTDPLTTALPTARSSVDSGNDGDESGLESSGAAWELRFSGQYLEKINDSNSLVPNRTIDRSNFENNPSNRLDAKVPADEPIRNKRTTASDYDDVSSVRCHSAASRRELIRPTLQQQHRNSLLEEMLRSQAILDKRTTNKSRAYTRSQSFVATRPLATPATQPVLHDRFSSLDSNDSAQSWNVLVLPDQINGGRDRKDGRADTKCSAYSEDSDEFRAPSSPGPQSPDLERVTRSAVLLRKHRNSLRLERDLISKRLFNIRDKIKHNHKGHPTEPLHELANSDGNAMVVLEDRLKLIDTQLDTMDVRLQVQDGNTHTLPAPSKTKEKRQKFARRHTTAHLFSKLRQPLKGEAKRRSAKKNDRVDVILKQDSIDGQSVMRQRSLSYNHHTIAQQIRKSRLSHGSDEPLERGSVSSIESGTLQNATPTEELDRLSLSTQGTVESSPRTRRISNASTTISQWKDESHELTDAMEKIEDFENFSALVSAQMDGSKYMYYSDV